VRAVSATVDPPVELRQLRYFVAVAEELHFGRAAERLHMSQSPLSRAIRELERELGFVLFVRTTRRVELTAAGSALLERARLALAEVDLAADLPDRSRDGAASDRGSRAATPARTDYLEFEGRPHLFVVGDGADEVAVAIDSWLDGVLDAAPVHRGGEGSG
jgi:hypothetical protein